MVTLSKMHLPNGLKSICGVVVLEVVQVQKMLRMVAGVEVALHAIEFIGQDLQVYSVQVKRLL
jgi:hypothetical protein